MGIKGLAPLGLVGYETGTFSGGHSNGQAGKVIGLRCPQGLVIYL